MSNPQSNTLAKREMMQSLSALIEKKRDAFAMVAGKHFDPDRLVKLAQGALARTPKLAECTPASVLVALMRCAELDLEPDAALPQRRMWLVPRWNSKLKAQECTFIMDYRAQLQKARDSGLVKSLIAVTVHEKDPRPTLKYDATGESIAKSVQTLVELSGVYRQTPSQQNFNALVHHVAQLTDREVCAALCSAV